MITNEEWKSIEGYTRYEVSNMGKVRNIHTKQLKAIRQTKTGYCITDLKENGQKKTAYVHRLVAQAFIENAFSYPCINHKDENKANNCVDNLEWCSVEYNNKYGKHNQKIRETKTRLYGCKVAQVDRETGEVIKIYKSKKEGAEAIGVKPPAIDWALSKPTHTSGGYRWVVVG